MEELKAWLKQPQNYLYVALVIAAITWKSIENGLRGGLIVVIVVILAALVGFVVRKIFFRR